MVRNGRAHYVKTLSCNDGDVQLARRTTAGITTSMILQTDITYSYTARSGPPSLPLSDEIATPSRQATSNMKENWALELAQGRQSSGQTVSETLFGVINSEL